MVNIAIEKEQGKYVNKKVLKNFILQQHKINNINKIFAKKII